MSKSEDILAELKEKLNLKIAQRKAIINQLSLLDVQIDGFDELIINMDKTSVGITDAINSSVTPVKDAYDARIAAECRTNLKWVVTDEWTQYVQGGAGDGATLYNVTFTTYKCKNNPDTYDYKPYYGLKYYKKPLNRDYGYTVSGEFVGNVSAGSSIIAITQESGRPTGINEGDRITDNVVSPSAFSASNLPKVVGFGTTSIVSISTSLVGGISTGSNAFAHFGSGSLTNVTAGMLLINPGILTDFTRITGFGVTNYVVQYFTGGGILTTGIITCTSVLLDKPALGYIEEAIFNVGVVSTYPSIFISTTSNQSLTSNTFTAIRQNSLDAIDESFDYTANPNAPLTIGVINSSSLGFGHSIYLDNSGDPSTTKNWDPNKSYIDPTVNSRSECEEKKNTEWDGKNKNCVKKPEPAVGAGRAEYNIGTTQWPILSTPILSGDTVIGYATTYAEQGDTVTVADGYSTTGVSIGYVSIGPSGVNPSGAACNALNSNITSATNNMNSVISAKSGEASGLINASRGLRKERDEKELYAWSLLQSSSRLREEIASLKQSIKDIEAVDFRPFE